jgi:hypothetical protein
MVLSREQEGVDPMHVEDLANRLHSAEELSRVCCHLRRGRRCSFTSARQAKHSGIRPSGDAFMRGNNRSGYFTWQCWQRFLPLCRCLAVEHFAAVDWRLAACLLLLVLPLVMQRLLLDRPWDSRHQLPCGSADRCAHCVSCQQILMYHFDPARSLCWPLICDGSPIAVYEV